jgi:hypothetical protein
MKTKMEERRMGKRNWFVVAGFCLVALGVSGQRALAQQPAQLPAGDTQAQVVEDIQLTRVAINAERQALVTRAMDLTPEEMQGFWPLYRQYRLEAIKVGDRIVALMTTYADNYETLTHGVADKLLTEFVSIEKERARLKAKYLPKFKKVLPPRKVARFYQIENKMDIAILAEMAENIPLAR